MHIISFIISKKNENKSKLLVKKGGKAQTFYKPLTQVLIISTWECLLCLLKIGGSTKKLRVLFSKEYKWIGPVSEN